MVKMLNYLILTILPGEGPLQSFVKLDIVRSFLALVAPSHFAAPTGVRIRPYRERFEFPAAPLVICKIRYF